MVEGTWGWSKGEYIERLKGENWRQGEGGAGVEGARWER